MPRPTETPIGLVLSRAAKAAERAFDDALVTGGGSRPVWMVLMTLKTARPTNQSDLAAAVGIRAATLSHHLNAMENDGLVTRVRNPDNRRIHLVALTDQGEKLFRQLVGVARAHDRRLRAGLDEDDIARLRTLLARMQANAGAR